MQTSPKPENLLRRWLNVYGPKPLAIAAFFLLAMAAAAKFLYETRGPWNKLVLARMASGKDFDLKHWIPYGIGWGCIAMLVVGAFILLTARWWMRPTGPALKAMEKPTATKRGAMLYVVGLLLAACLCGWLRAPRLTHSFWNDEEMAFRDYVWGKYKVSEDSKLTFHPTTWQSTLYAAGNGNNHVLSSVESKLGMALLNDPALKAPEGVPGFQESAARFIPWLEGCLTVVAIGWLGWVLGRPRVGLAAALLLALHPWHMRYAVEIRGYSAHLLYLCVATACLIRALQSPGWRWWLGYGVTQGLAILAFPGCLYWALLLNVVCVAILIKQSEQCVVHALRLVVANGVTLAISAALLSPVLFQALEMLSRPENRGVYPPATVGWLRDFWHHLAIGFPESQRDVADSAGSSLELISRTVTPWAKILVQIILPAFVLAGIVGLLKRDWRGWLVVVPPLAAAALAFGNSAAKGSPLLAQYLIYLLPLFCISFAWAPAWLPGPTRNVLFILVGGYGMLTRGPRDTLCRTPRQPMREAAQFARQEANVPTGDHKNTLTVVFGQSAGQIGSYDPRAIELAKTEDGGLAELQKLTTLANQTKQSLIVYFCNEDRAASQHREVMNALADGENWMREKSIPGVETMWSYTCYTYIPDQNQP